MHTNWHVGCSYRTHSVKIGLTINSDKTKFSWFCSHYKFPDCPKNTPIIKGAPLKLVDHFTYLGADLDRPMSMKKHADKCLKETNFLSFKFANIRDNTIISKDPIQDLAKY